MKATNTNTSTSTNTSTDANTIRLDDKQRGDEKHRTHEKQTGLRDGDGNDGRLVHLDEVKDRFELADGSPDVRGWKVKGGDDKDIGEVAGLMVDTRAGRVRYLELELDDDVAEGASKWMLVPIGRARLDDDKDEVRLADSWNDLRMRGTGDRAQMRSGVTGRSDQSYAGDDFDESRFLGVRGRRAGTSGGSYFVPVAVTEEVVVVATPVRGDAASGEHGTTGAMPNGSSGAANGLTERSTDHATDRTSERAGVR